MRFGVIVLPVDPVANSIERVQALERLGYSHMWVYDHLSWRRYRGGPWHATHPWLTAMAMSTSSIGLGTMVSNLNLRHPATLAKDAMTIDHISRGRVTVGIGAGGLGFDASVLGAAPLTPRQRVDRMAEFLDALDRLGREKGGSHDGDWYVVDDVELLPGSVREPRVRIAIAAGGRRTTRLAAQYAETWITYGIPSVGEVRPDDVEPAVVEQLRWFEDDCDAAGRDPASVDRLLMVPNHHERPMSSIERFVDFVGRYEAHGFTDVVVHDPRPGDPVFDDDPEIIAEIAATLI